MVIRLSRRRISFSKIAIFALIVSMWGFVDVPLFTLAAQLFFFVSLGVELMQKQHGVIKKSRYILWEVLWGGICCVSIIWSKQKPEAITKIVAVFQMLLINFFLITWVKDKVRLEYIFDLFILAGVALAIRLIIVTPLSDWGKDRFGMAIGMHVNTTSINLLISELFAVYKCMTIRDKKRSLLYLFSVVFFCVVIIASASKKTAILMVLGPVLMLMTSKKDVKSLLKGVFIVLVGCVGLIFLIQTYPELFAELMGRMEGFINLLTSSGVVDKSTADRQYLMSKAISVF